MNATAGLASVTGTASSPDADNQSPAGLATVLTGNAYGSGIYGGGIYGLITGSGLTPGLASATGAAQTPDAGNQSPLGLASATGKAAVLSTTTPVRLASAAGTASVPSVQVGAGAAAQEAGLASAFGTAQDIPVAPLIAGLATAVAATDDTYGTGTYGYGEYNPEPAGTGLTPGLAAATALTFSSGALTPPIAAATARTSSTSTLTPGLAAATGRTFSSGALVPLLASAIGIAQSPAIVGSGTVTPRLASAAGTVLGGNGLRGTGLASATGTAQAPGIRIGAGLAHLVTAATTGNFYDSGFYGGGSYNGLNLTGWSLGSGLASGAGGHPAGTGISQTPGLAAGAGIVQNPVFISSVANTCYGIAGSPAAGLAILTGLASGRGAATRAINGIVSPPLVVSGFGTFPGIPAGAVIVSVIALIDGYCSNTSMVNPYYELWNGTTAIIGTSQSGTVSVTPGHTDFAVFPAVAFSQLSSLQLRIYGESPVGNSGASFNIDAVSLSVAWTPVQAATAAPGVLPAVAVVESGVTVCTGEMIAMTPLTSNAAFPVPATGTAAAFVYLSAIAVTVAEPVPFATAGQAAAPATLSLSAVVPAIADFTPDYWATADSIPGGGWTNPGNAVSSPDGSYASWVLP